MEALNPCKCFNVWDLKLCLSVHIELQLHWNQINHWNNNFMWCSNNSPGPIDLQYPMRYCDIYQHHVSNNLFGLLLINVLGGGGFLGGPIWLIGSTERSIMPYWYKTCQIGRYEQQVLLQTCVVLWFHGDFLASVFLCPVYSDGQLASSWGVNPFPLSEHRQNWSDICLWNRWDFFVEKQLGRWGLGLFVKNTTLQNKNLWTHTSWFPLFWTDKIFLVFFPFF